MVVHKVLNDFIAIVDSELKGIDNNLTEQEEEETLIGMVQIAEIILTTPKILDYLRTKEVAVLSSLSIRR